MRPLILLLTLFTTHYSFFTTFAATGEHPNVIVILADDQGWGDLSLHGNQNLNTPALDKLARQGAQFTNFYVQPVCSPTRAEFLTGRYYPRSGVYSTGAGGERIDADEQLISEVFRDAGYSTGAFGKWHSGTQAPYHPNTRGFDEYYGFTSGHWGSYFDAMLDHNGEMVTSSGYLPDALTTAAIEFIKEQNKAGVPSFTYLALPTPHSPMQTTDEDWARFKSKKLSSLATHPEKEDHQHTRAALAMVENIDQNVARVLKCINDLDINKNTIVVYFTDNGPNGWRWNGDMKGRKGTADEGGVRVPCLIRWPKVIPAGREVKQIGGAIDLLPTLADLSGIPVASKKPLDGVSMKAQILGDDEPIDRRIVSHWRGKVSVRNQRFRLGHKGQLFDIPADPGQRTNVARKHPKVLAALQMEADHFRNEVIPTNLGKVDDRTFPLGSKDFRYTQIPARDATAIGGLKRSNRFPNCSYFTNWTSTNDKLTWDVDVMEPGEYGVTMYYTCPASDIGSTIELTCGESKTISKISVAHDPAVRGAAEDRFKRVESYVKDFRPMSLGAIRLERGEQTLSLRATKIPGNIVGEFRLLMFERK